MPIPAPLRAKVWKKYFGDTSTAKCLCCSHENISFSNWHCGHIIPQAKGGPTTIDNLVPICAGCNTSMRDQHLISYMKSHGYDITHIQIPHFTSLVHQCDMKEIHIMNGAEFDVFTQNAVIPSAITHKKLFIDDPIIRPTIIGREISSNTLLILSESARYTLWKTTRTGDWRSQQWLIIVINLDSSNIRYYLNLCNPSPYNTKVDELMINIITRWPGAVSNTDSPHKPRFNVQQIRAAILNAITHDFDVDTIFNKIVAENDKHITIGASDSQIAAARSCGWYLGLQRDWYKNLFDNDDAINIDVLPPQHQQELFDLVLKSNGFNRFKQSVTCDTASITHIRYEISPVRRLIGMIKALSGGNDYGITDELSELVASLAVTAESTTTYVGCWQQLQHIYNEPFRTKIAAIAAKYGKVSFEEHHPTHIVKGEYKNQLFSHRMILTVRLLAH